jgi:predicted amidohydrolase YtcJ
MSENKIQLMKGRIFLSEEKIIEGEVVINGEVIEDITKGSKPHGEYEVIDLDGRLVIPGFIDSHTHLLQGGIEMMRPDLTDTESFEEVCEIIREVLPSYERGEMVIASNYDESKWVKRENPTKEDLDRISPENPLILRRICGHCAIANSRALEMIPRARTGVDLKTGVLKEDVPLNINKIFPPKEDLVREGLRKVVKKANRLGITSIHEVIKLNHIDFYEEMSSDELTLNVRLYVPVNDLHGVRIPTREFSRTTFGGVKIFVDGSIGARTAANTFSYADDPSSKGLLLYSQAELDTFVSIAEEKGVQLMVHAIGNDAVKKTLHAFLAHIKERNVLRHKIEHVELIDLEDITILRKSGVIASMQPNFIGLWSQRGGMYEHALGERFEINNPIGVMKKRGVIVAFGSDSMPLSPLVGIKGVVEAPFECQRITMEGAIECYTKNSAFAGFSEHKEGTIVRGNLANIVILSRDGKSIYRTFFKGRCVYSS